MSSQRSQNQKKLAELCDKYEHLILEKQRIERRIRELQAEIKKLEQLPEADQ